MPMKEWDKTDQALMTSYTVINIIDIGQTREILDNSRYHELNPVMKDMSPDTATLFMAGTNVVLYYSADWIGDEYRTPLLTVANCIKIGCVGKNISIGLGFGW